MLQYSAVIVTIEIITLADYCRIGNKISQRDNCIAGMAEKVSEASM